jgi:hypothetical protein
MKPRPWRTEIGMVGGLAVGAILWWVSLTEGDGFLPNPQLLILPTALGAALVAWRNKQQQVGVHDPEIIVRNKRGRV